MKLALRKKMMESFGMSAADNIFCNFMLLLRARRILKYMYIFYSSTMLKYVFIFYAI